MRVAALAALLLLACQPGNPVAANQAGTNVAAAKSRPGTVVSSDDPAPLRPAPDGSSDDCPILESSAWSAHVDAMPGPNARPRLIVSGTVTVPTGGYRIEWGDFRVAESYPVQIFADLRVVPPSGPATQAVVTHNVRGEWPMDQPVGSVAVRCGNRLLARISPVETAH